MLLLTDSLLAAQKGASRRPYVRVEARQRIGNIARPAYQRLYTGSEDDFFHAACMPGDGSLVRARVDATTYQLYHQRVASPGPGSGFSAWTSVTTVSSVSGVALAAQGAAVLLFYVDTDQKTICVRESNDYGATFGSPTSITTAASAVGHLAADVSDSGVVALLYSVGAQVYAVKRSAGSWGTPSAWTNSVGSVSGLGCVYSGDWNLVVTGQDSDGDSFAWTCVYGDGYGQSAGTWSALSELTTASVGSSVSFHCPFVAEAGVFRLFFVEKYAGTVAYQRPFWSYAMASSGYVSARWREPIPFDLSCEHGVALAYGGGKLWLCVPSGVWQADLAVAPQELTPDVLALETSVGPQGGEAWVELRNDDGRYSTLGSGVNAVLQVGAELCIQTGYRTSAGDEAPLGGLFWVEGWEHRSSGGRATLRLHAYDGWGLLRRWRARRQFAWAQGQKNVFQLLSFVLARAGLEFSTSGGSSELGSLYPAFTIHPNETGQQAVRRLLAMVPDVLFFRCETAYATEPQSGEATDYAYGTDHPILSAGYGTAAQAANRVQAYGDGVMAEEFSWSQVERVFERLEQVHDLNLDSASEVSSRAQAVLRKAELDSRGGRIVVPPNCGQELWDVVEVTDARAGLSQARRRVVGLGLSYSVEPPRYEQRLELGEV